MGDDDVTVISAPPPRVRVTAGDVVEAPSARAGWTEAGVCIPASTPRGSTGWPGDGRGRTVTERAERRPRMLSHVDRARCPRLALAGLEPQQHGPHQKVPSRHGVHCRRTRGRELGPRSRPARPTSSRRRSAGLACRHRARRSDRRSQRDVECSSVKIGVDEPPGVRASLRPPRIRRISIARAADAERRLVLAGPLGVPEEKMPCPVDSRCPSGEPVGPCSTIAGTRRSTRRCDRSGGRTDPRPQGTGARRAGPAPRASRAARSPHRRCRHPPRCGP